MAAFDPRAVTLAILAGGEGRRMGGRDKGLVELSGKPLVAHVVEALRGQAADVLICANRNAGEYARYGAVVADAASGFPGPLAGIAAALARSATPWLLTAPVDAPCPPRDLAHRLFAAAANANAAVAFEHAQRQPLFALYRRDLAESATAALARGLPVWRWQQEIGAADVVFAEAGPAFANLNDADDIAAWEVAHG